MKLGITDNGLSRLSKVVAQSEHEMIDQASMNAYVEPGEAVYCERCGQKLAKNNRIWLCLDQDTGNYYDYWTENNQGVFVFGKDCAKDILSKGGKNEFIMHLAD